jgi:hypothetical protein
MHELLRIKQDILARGKVDSDHLESLKLALYSGGKVSRPAADYLVELHKRVQHPNPGFEHLFYKVIKDHVLVNGKIDAEEVGWLRRMLFADGKIKDEERKFLHELKGEAKVSSPAFDELFTESMKEPQEQHTSG